MGPSVGAEFPAAAAVTTEVCHAGLLLAGAPSFGAGDRALFRLYPGILPATE